MAAVLIYSIFTAACGFAQSAMQLAVFRVLLGLGMGGEWATGAALVSESFPAKHRGKALAFVQSSWAIGYGLAALVNLIVMPLWGWRGVFFVGVLPALFTLWIRRQRRGAEDVASTHRRPSAAASALLFAPDIATITVFITLMNACMLFGWWGLNSWVPAYLRLVPAQGGIGLSSSTMSLFVIAMQVGMWFGYVSFGFIADAIGRKRTYVIFLLAAACCCRSTASCAQPVDAARCSGRSSRSSAPATSAASARSSRSCIRPSVRATAAGVCYNTGRIASAAAPFVVGSLAQRRGFGVAFRVAGAAFLLAAVTWIWIPETRNRELT